MRRRFRFETRSIQAYYGLLWAMERQLREENPAIGGAIRALRREMGREFGFATRLVGGLLGPVLLWTSRREQRRLQRGQTYEPTAFRERRNWEPAPAER